MRNMILIVACILTTFVSQAFTLTQDDRYMENQNKHPKVSLKTNMGTIVVELYEDKAPKTVENFLSYVKEGHYDHTIFHRVIDGFMIQGGGFTKDFEQKPTKAPVVNEAQNGLKNSEGTLAMARTGVVNSATSQFFINVTDNPFLDYRGNSPAEYGYCVFGKVIEGMDVVKKMKGVKTSSKGMHQNVPVETIEILEAKVLEN